MDLSDFDLKMIHVPGRLLAGPDALSCRPDLLPKSDSDNDGVTLLPESLFVNVIDTALSSRIQSASSSDPLVLQALQSMKEDIPAAFCSRLFDWQLDARVLTYQGRVYIPADDSLCRSILKQCHDHASASHLGYLKTRQ